MVACTQPARGGSYLPRDDGRGGAGTLEVRSTAETQINAKLAIGSATASGELLMVGGSVKGTGLLTVNSAGTIRGRGGIYTPINNHGTIDVDTSSIMLYNTLDSDGEKLEPLKFSNGKTQKSVVKEILD
ncbi:MAG: hypothetical protein U9N87_02300, partial [Planctomycetota bacterium]|nr:hypothetical protein [Planctomycetota bacterium]